MFDFHPTRRARWEPIVSGLIFAAAGFLAGWKWAGNMDSGLFLAGLIFLVVGLGERIAWMRIVSRSYAPVPVERIAHAREADLTDFDPARIPITCIANPQDTHVLHNLPVEYDALQRYADGILHDGKSTVYSEWHGAGKEFTDQDDYKALVDWFVLWRYGLLTHRNTLVINERGLDLLADVLQPQFKPPSPIETGYQREIYIHSDINPKT